MAFPYLNERILKNKSQMSSLRVRPVCTSLRRLHPSPFSCPIPSREASYTGGEQLFPLQRSAILYIAPLHPSPPPFWFLNCIVQRGGRGRFVSRPGWLRGCTENTHGMRGGNVHRGWHPHWRGGGRSRPRSRPGRYGRFGRW